MRRAAIDRFVAVVRSDGQQNICSTSLVVMATEAATILHADLDAFYASVEQLLDPDLRDRPIAVGGGVVLAASYEAKAFGIQGGMPGWRARQLCPHLRFVGGHFSDYQRYGDQVMEIMADFTPAPDGIVVVEPGDERQFLVPLPVELLWGVGPVTRQRLADRGIATIGQLAGVRSTAPSTT